MGGPIAFRTAAAVPDRVGAVASFHGGGLVTPNPQQPASAGGENPKRPFLVAIAANDDQRAPKDKDVLKETFSQAKVQAEIEVYPGAHGWCPPDSTVYNEPDAEKAWSRLIPGALRKGAGLSQGLADSAPSVGLAGCVSPSAEPRRSARLSR